MTVPWCITGATKPPPGVDRFTARLVDRHGNDAGRYTNERWNFQAKYVLHFETHRVVFIFTGWCYDIGHGSTLVYQQQEEAK